MAAVRFLVDTGADRTMLSADALELLALPTEALDGRIWGAGGLVPATAVATHIRLRRDDGRDVKFRGTYAACTDRADLDMSVLGRDILDIFAVIVDHPANVVAILGDNHHYTVGQRQP